VSKVKQAEIRQLVVTLSGPKDDVVKVEHVEASGERHEITDQEFAELAGEDEEFLGAALEEAYEAGLRDAIAEEYGEHYAEEEDEPRHLIRQEAAARRLLRRGVRQLILRRALRRLGAPKPAPSESSQKAAAAR
jgi:hypothetical protein